MRTINIPDITTDPHLILPTDTHHESTHQNPTPPSLRSYLPPWLGGPDPRTQPLPRMLSALKIATESYISTPLPSAEIVFPFPIPSTFLTTLRSATPSLSLTMPLSAQSPSGILAARAHGIGARHCSDDDDAAVHEQLILTIDYNRAALTALLVHKECSIFEVRRVVHDPHLGTAQHSHCAPDTEPEPASNAQSRRDDLVRAIRDVARLPLEQGNGAGISRISEVVLLGEKAGDALLHEVLKEVLGEEFGGRLSLDGGVRGEGGEECSGRIEPVFAASRGLAMDCWDRLDLQDREGGSGSGDEL